MSTNYCEICQVFRACEQMNVGLCRHCVENSNTNNIMGTLKGICEKIKTSLKEDCNTEMYLKYEQLSKAFEKICTEEQFKTIKSFINGPFITLEAAISHLISFYVMNGCFYFTSSQAKELVKKIWPKEIYKWHNLLVFMCLDLNELETDEFTCGICYFANMGEKFSNPVRLTNYLVGRGFDISNKMEYFGQ